MNPANIQEHLWSVILAGGDGIRLASSIKSWLGRCLPKQYCTFVGTRSMLQHTLDRADLLSRPEKKVIVISASHRKEAWPQMHGRNPGKVIEQPLNCDTSAGIFVAIAYILSHDAKAMIVIHPSDHFVHPEEPFITVVKCAIQAAERLRGRMVLLGVRPDRPETDYGWIQQGHDFGRVDGHRVRAVHAFLEKPNATEAMQAMQKDALWNTLVAAAGAEWLWETGWHCQPEMMSRFEQMRDAFGTQEEKARLESIYHKMPSRNFSSQILERVCSQIAVIELSGVLWSDWGNWQRILETLHRIGKPPAFAMGRACAS